MPNLAFTFGYTNASWTLKADLVSEFVCRVLNYMDANGFDRVEPQHPGDTVDELPLMDFTPGYFCGRWTTCSEVGIMSRRGGSSRTTCFDMRMIRHGKVDDEALHVRQTPCAGGGFGLDQHV